MFFHPRKNVPNSGILFYLKLYLVFIKNSNLIKHFDSWSCEYKEPTQKFGIYEAIKFSKETEKHFG